MRSLACAALLGVLGVSAAWASISIDGGLTREFMLRPGQQQEGIITVLNSANHEVRIRIYQTDYRFYADGSNHYDDPGTGERSNADWISFSPRETVIAPRGSVEIYYRIDMPEDPALTGSFWSMLMVEPVPVAEDPLLSDDQPALGVRMVVRHGIQIAVTVPGAGRKLIEPRGELLAGEEGPVLGLEVANTGECLVHPVVWAEVFDAQGQLAGRLTSEAQRIYPGCSVMHRFPLDFPPGQYQALVVMDNQDGEVWGSRYNFEIP